MSLEIIQKMKRYPYEKVLSRDIPTVSCTHFSWQERKRVNIDVGKYKLSIDSNNKLDLLIEMLESFRGQLTED